MRGSVHTHLYVFTMKCIQLSIILSLVKRCMVLFWKYKRERFLSSVSLATIILRKISFLLWVHSSKNSRDRWCSPTVHSWKTKFRYSILTVELYQTQLFAVSQLKVGYMCWSKWFWEIQEVLPHFKCWNIEQAA